MSEPLDPLRNPLDPLHDANEAAKELFRNISAVASGFPHEIVVEAALNVLLNAIRQTQPKRRGANQMFDEFTQRAKTVLLEKHYDASGERRNVFPFDQRIDVPRSVFKQRF